MELFLEWLLLGSLSAALIWQFIWMVLLDRLIQKWNELEEKDRNGDV